MPIMKAAGSLKEWGWRDDCCEGWDERRWISCGDYQIQDIAAWREAIIKRLGSEGVSELQVDEDGYYYFEHPEIPEGMRIDQDLGITHSGPSSSSLSS